MEGLDGSLAAAIAVVHDLAEASVGDITPRDGVPSAMKEELERDALDGMCLRLADGGPGLAEAAASVRAMWGAYAAAASPEARLVKDCDKIEMCLQALEYEVEVSASGLRDPSAERYSWEGGWRGGVRVTQTRFAPPVLLDRALCASHSIALLSAHLLQWLRDRETTIHRAHIDHLYARVFRTATASLPLLRGHIRIAFLCFYVSPSLPARARARIGLQPLRPRCRARPSQADERCLDQFIDCVTPARLHTAFAKACLADIVRRRDDLLPPRLPGAGQDSAAPRAKAPRAPDDASTDTESDADEEPPGSQTRASSTARRRRSSRRRRLLNHGQGAGPTAASAAVATETARPAPVLPARLHLRSAESTASEAASLIASNGFVPGLATKLGLALARIAADDTSPAALAVAALDNGKPRALVAQALRVMRPLAGSRQGAGAPRLPASVAGAFVSPFGRDPADRSAEIPTGPDALGMPQNCGVGRCTDAQPRQSAARGTEGGRGGGARGDSPSSGGCARWWRFCGPSDEAAWGQGFASVTLPVPLLALLLVAAVMVGSVLGPGGGLEARAAV